FHYVRDASYWSSVKWVHERPNVVVARTFSKIYAMAGMRVGFGVADPATARRLRAFQGRNNVSNLSLLAAKASLEDEEFARRSLEANNRGKAILYAALDELGLEYLPSHTNFVMHRIKGDLETYIARMRERNIRVGRPFPPMLEYNRISIGLPEEMEVFVDALRDFRGKGWL
ncbi:MAG: aminotransferase class I/II-fold pyridoxal phosphate-dependent enzyme, partial [Gemmatimonadales bacterium]